MVKFKYISDKPRKNIDLVLNHVLLPNDVLIKDTVIDVPDNNKSLIRKLNVSGNYVKLAGSNSSVPKVTKSKEDKEVDKNG